MMWRQIKALWTLGMALLRKLLVMPFVRNTGAGPWLARIRQESLAPAPADAWRRFAPSSRCIGCGLCDAVGDARFAPSAAILADGRRPEDAPLVVADAEQLQRLASEIAAVCPARVGVADLATLIIDNARMLETP
jgi:hypothetical protein